MKASMLSALIGMLIGAGNMGSGVVRTLPTLHNRASLAGRGRNKVPAATYGKHTCSSTPEQIRSHNLLVNTRQVMRFRSRKPNHPSNATYDY